MRAFQSALESLQPTVRATDPCEDPFDLAAVAMAAKASLDLNERLANLLPEALTGRVVELR
jgi:hypothetical protein